MRFLGPDRARETVRGVSGASTLFFSRSSHPSPSAAMFALRSEVARKNRASPEETASTKASIGRMDQSMVRNRSRLAGAGIENEALLKVNAAKKNSGWILAAILVVLTIFPDRFGGDYFRFNVLLAALGTLTLWVSLVILVSWVFRVCGSMTRLVRKSHRESSPSKPPPACQGLKRQSENAWLTPLDGRLATDNYLGSAHETDNRVR
jgi:hypothetical protein